MTRRNVAALLALLSLSACAAPSLYPEPAPAPSVWLEPGQLGYEEQAKWGLPLPKGFGVVVLPPALFLLNCQAVNGDCDASTLATTLQAEHRVLLRDDLGALAPFAMMHEMGHILRGVGGHPGAEDCADAPVMCGDASAAHPGPADFGFVLGYSPER
jgi:hypothetical protein